MSSRLFARLAIANPTTQKISLSEEFIEVSEHDLSAMILPDHVVRVDLFTTREETKPKRRIIIGAEKIYSHAAIEDEFGPMFADRLAEIGAGYAVFIETLGKLIPAMPGDQVRHTNGDLVSIE